MEYQKKLINFVSGIKKYKLKLCNLRRTRRQLLQNIYFQKKLQLYYILMLHNRINWIHMRHGSFWEQDVPLMCDKQFVENFRMKRQTFDLLCSKMSAIAKSDTSWRKCISLQKRIAIALYTLKTSSEYASVAHMFGVSKASVCVILKDFCVEAWRALSPHYLPANFICESKIKECVEGFKHIGFPQCLGAIDGCHIEVHPPASEATDYYNYKGWYSVVLLAVVDYRYRFLYINVGCPGRCNDSAIFESSQLKKELGNPILKENSIILNGVKVPVMLIGDSAFRLSECIMKPYPFRPEAPIEQKNFNYSLSKSRRVVENAFGHLKARFRRIGKGIDNRIDNVNHIIKCCCVLHNFLNEQNEEINDLLLTNHLEINQKLQPNFQQFVFDYNPKGEEIRKAISIELMKK